MISCLARQVWRNPQGLSSSTESRFAGETLQIGRGAACQIHLADHRVGLVHATVLRAADGRLEITAEGDALIRVDGFVERTAALVAGTQVGIGPYLLTVAAPDGGTDLALVIDRADSQPAEAAAPMPQAVSLSALNISKRKLGLGLAAGILLLLLALPLASRISPAFENWQAGLPFPLTGLLNPGPLTPGHALFGAKCSVCHQDAFRPVGNAACTDCHRGMGTHLAAGAPLAKASAEMPCVDCHSAHRGKRLATGNPERQCTACHSRLDIPAAKVLDFGQTHPPFHWTIATGKAPLRVREDDARIPPERPGLKFSHQVHLDKQGVSSPDGRTVMTCRDCHRLDAGGEHFAPMTLEASCQQSRCHTLRFEEPLAGRIPHGPERLAMSRIREFFAAQVADAPAEAARPCRGQAQSGTALRRALDCAAGLAHDHAAESLFRTAGNDLVCALCHDISATGKPDMPWKVAPLRLNRDWQPKAVFPHARHATTGCGDCHDKTHSKSSDDIAFPRLAKCRECHAGADGAAGKVASTCQSCHRFHRTVPAPVAPTPTVGK